MMSKEVRLAQEELATGGGGGGRMSGLASRRNRNSSLRPKYLKKGETGAISWV